MNYTAKHVYTEKRIASDYDAKRFRSWRGKTVDRRERTYIAEGIAQLSGQSPNQMVLDAPSGTGRLTEELLQRGYRVVAVDISLEMMRQGEADRNLRSLPNFVGYVCADLEHLPFRSGALDVTCSLRVMGHLPPEVKRRVLDEFRRVSRVGAVIIFALDSAVLRSKRWVFQLLRLRPKPAMWFPASHPQIVSLASTNGWEIVASRDLVKWISESRLYVFRPRAIDR